MSHHVKEDLADHILLELDCPESLYDLRLFLNRDGRERGLWVWLEEDWEIRAERDAQLFDAGLKKLMAKMAEKPLDEFELRMHLRIFFDPFFGHRSEGRAVLLSWPKVKRLAAGLLKGHKAEAEKSEPLPSAPRPSVFSTPIPREVEGCPDCKPGKPCYGHGHGY